MQCILTFFLNTLHIFTGCPAQADIAFLLDSSGSVGRRNFMKVQEFVSEVASEMRY